MNNKDFESKQNKINTTNKGGKEMSRDKNRDDRQHEADKPINRREALMMRRAGSKKFLERAERQANSEKTTRRNNIRADRNRVRDEKRRAVREGRKVEQGRIEAVREHCRNARRKNSDGDCKGAMNELKAAIDLDPGNIDLLIERANLLQKMGQCGVALRAYDDVRLLVSTRANTGMENMYHQLATILFHRAETLEAMGRKDDAFESHSELVRLVEANGVNFNAYYGRSLMARCRFLLQNNRIRMAFEDSRKLLDGMVKGTIASSSEAWFLCGAALELKGQSTIGGHWDNSEAIENYERAIGLDPDCVQARSCLGSALIKMGKDSLAIVQFEKILEIDPDNADAMARLGWVFFNLQRHAEAARMCNRAIELNPDGERDPDAFHVHGFVAPRTILNFIDMGRENQSKNIANYRRIVGLDPDAQTHDDEDDAGMDRKFSRDIVRYNREISLDTMNASAYSRLADAQVGKGELEKASETYQLASSLEPDNIILLNKLAMVAIFRKRPGDVAAYCSEAFLLDAGDENADALLNEARKQLG